MLVGVHRYSLAIGSTIIVFFVLRAIPFIEPLSKKAGQADESSDLGDDGN